MRFGAAVGLLAWGLMTLQAQTSRYITAGRPVGPPVFSPEGLIFAASEDQRLHFLDAEGRLQASFTLNQRWAFGPVHGSGTWLAIVTTDRRLHRIDYTRPTPRQNGRLGLQWSVTLPARLAAPPALSVGGRVVLLFTDGQLRAWESDGGLAASVRLGIAAETGRLALDADGRVWAVLGTRLTVFGPDFRELGRQDLPEPVSQLLVDRQGRLWLLGENGRLWRLNGPTAAPIPLNYRNVVALLSDHDNLWVVTTQGALILDAQDRVRTRLETARRPTGAVVLASGALATALPNGGVLLLGQGLEEVRPSPPLEHLVLSPRGLLVGSSRDWSLYWWEWQPPPELGWNQVAAAADGSHRVRRPLEPAAQRERWEGFNGFRIARLLLERGGRDDVEQVLGNLERAHREGGLDTIPYAPGLLLEICRTGIERLRVENLQLINDWPDLRLRAAALLAEVLDWSLRPSLLELLRIEGDARVQVQIVGLLERLGWDADGSAAATLTEVLRRTPDPRLAEAALRFVDRLRATGASYVTAHRVLLNQIMVGPYPRALRERAWQLLRT